MTVACTVPLHMEHGRIRHCGLLHKQHLPAQLQGAGSCHTAVCCCLPEFCQHQRVCHRTLYHIALLQVSSPESSINDDGDAQRKKGEDLLKHLGAEPTCRASCLSSSLMIGVAVREQLSARCMLCLHQDPSFKILGQRRVK